MGEGTVDRGWGVAEVGFGPGQRGAEVGFVRVRAEAAGAVVASASPRDGGVDASGDADGSVAGALIGEGVAEPLDRALPGDDVAVTVEQAVQVAEALLAVAAQDGEGGGPQFDAVDGAGADGCRWHGWLVDPGRATPAVERGEPDGQVRGVIGELVHVAPAAGREALELAVDLGEPGAQGSVGVAPIGP